MFKSTGLAKMFAGRRKFFRGPHVRHLWPSKTGSVLFTSKIEKSNAQDPYIDDESNDFGVLFMVLAFVLFRLLLKLFVGKMNLVLHFFVRWLSGA